MEVLGCTTNPLTRTLTNVPRQVVFLALPLKQGLAQQRTVSRKRAHQAPTCLL